MKLLHISDLHLTDILDEGLRKKIHCFCEYLKKMNKSKGTKFDHIVITGDLLEPSGLVSDCVQMIDEITVAAGVKDRNSVHIVHIVPGHSNVTQSLSCSPSRSEMLARFDTFRQFCDQFYTTNCNPWKPALLHTKFASQRNDLVILYFNSCLKYDSRNPDFYIGQLNIDSLLSQSTCAKEIIILSHHMPPPLEIRKLESKLVAKLENVELLLWLCGHDHDIPSHRKYFTKLTVDKRKITCYQTGSLTGYNNVMPHFSYYEINDFHVPTPQLCYFSETSNTWQKRFLL